MNETKYILISIILFLFLLTGCASLGGRQDHVSRGNTFYQADRYDDAIQAYSQALQEDPGNVEAHFKRGVIFQKKKNFEMAIQEYNETIRLDSSHLKAHFNLGLIYSYVRVDYIKAIYFMERFVELAPEHTYVPEAQSRIAVMKKKAYGDSEDDTEGTKSLLDLTDELSR